MTAPEQLDALAADLLSRSSARYANEKRAFCISDADKMKKAAAAITTLRAEIARLTAERDAALAGPVAWLPDEAYKWLITYDGPACARVTAIHRVPLKAGFGVPLYTAPQPAPAIQAREITVQDAARVLLDAHAVVRAKGWKDCTEAEREIFIMEVPALRAIAEQGGR